MSSENVQKGQVKMYNFGGSIFRDIHQGCTSSFAALDECHGKEQIWDMLLSVTKQEIKQPDVLLSVTKQETQIGDVSLSVQKY